MSIFEVNEIDGVAVSDLRLNIEVYDQEDTGHELVFFGRLRRSEILVIGAGGESMYFHYDDYPYAKGYYKLLVKHLKEKKIRATIPGAINYNSKE